LGLEKRESFVSVRRRSTDLSCHAFFSLRPRINHAVSERETTVSEVDHLGLGKKENLPFVFSKDLLRSNPEGVLHGKVLLRAQFSYKSVVYLKGDPKFTGNCRGNELVMGRRSEFSS
jgi:hypothetical protein